MQWQDKGQGFLRKNLSGESEYSSFIPSSLDTVVPVELSEETVRLLSACSRKLGELEGMLRFVPNASMYLAMYVRKEALLSAQIEGSCSARSTTFSILRTSNWLNVMSPT